MTDLILEAQRAVLMIYEMNSITIIILESSSNRAAETLKVQPWSRLYVLGILLAASVLVIASRIVLTLMLPVSSYHSNEGAVRFCCWNSRMLNVDVDL